MHMVDCTKTYDPNQNWKILQQGNLAQITQENCICLKIGVET